MIIHKTIFKEYYAEGVKEYSYLCNQACNTTKEKLSVNWKKVNCKNCLKMKKKETICFYCGDNIKGKAHKEICLSWKKDIKKLKKENGK